MARETFKVLEDVKIGERIVESGDIITVDSKRSSKINERIRPRHNQRIGNRILEKTDRIKRLKPGSGKIVETKEPGIYIVTENFLVKTDAYKGYEGVEFQRGDKIQITQSEKSLQKNIDQLRESISFKKPGIMNPIR